MKRTGIDHPKARRLAKLLDIHHYAAIGILECLWHFTARHAITGDVGRWSDEEIAAAIGWPEDEALRLINALTDSGWLDRHEAHRLIVHDWGDHCDEAVKKTVGRKGWQFACRDLSRHVETESDNVATCRDNGGNCRDSLSLSQSQSQSHSHKPEPKPREPPKLRFDPLDHDLAQEMIGHIKTLNPNAKDPNVDQWSNEIRLLRSDGPDRTAEGIRAMMTWVYSNDFWRGNILSPVKLRKHWDTITIQMKEKTNGNLQQRPGKRDGLYRSDATASHDL